MVLSRAELEKFAGKTGIHNHPASSAFSPEDLRSFVDSGAVEWRVVGPETRYIMQRPLGGWPANISEILDRLEKKHLAQAQRRLSLGNSRAQTAKRAVFLLSAEFSRLTGAPFQFIAEAP